MDVEFYYASASEIVKNVAANNVEFGFPNSDPKLSLDDQMEFQLKLFILLIKKKSRIHYLQKEFYYSVSPPKIYKGKTIGITSLWKSLTLFSLQVILEQVGLSLDDVSIKIIGTGAIVNSLVSDQVDAISFSMLRAYDLQEQGLTVESFALKTTCLHKEMS